mmetsp:Transcript_32479/g.64278  ORF Transcript_32479/g.64278 Transcript_32479/m.64278 type:complete len:289 (+) Transcript_32479:310-1176(+)|eukprot:CAMPEP_0182484646 /NCGR_PEP_ID=MMETSP1319-20130603/43811_1 /TAXON_ID=172717 /ORGANISM="Bolidomonas pacifica, Strain RCC208" /LENGTH=288 /DNA_ID=CAMNT_0024686561 /DNA_START=342 /DNA_END=1208 /DNA_ORIENTATION=+
MTTEAELKLHEYSEDLKEHVMKSANIMNTSFLYHFDGLVPKSKISLASLADLEEGGTSSSPSAAIEPLRFLGDTLKGDTLKGGNSEQDRLKAMTTRKYRHGQHSGARVCGTFGYANKQRQKGKLEDDHHSPLTPDEYLKYRVEPQLNFYRKRLPKYSRMRFFFEMVKLIGSILGTILAFLGLSHWAAVPTAVVAAFHAYSEFHGTERKLLRYSNCISRLETILLWWRTMNVNDKALLDNKTRLVTECEETFESERQAWVTSSMKSRKLGSGDDKTAQEWGDEGISTGD